MNRHEFVKLATKKLISSKRGYGEVSTAFTHAKNLFIELDRLGFLNALNIDIKPENGDVDKQKAIIERAEFVIEASIDIMAADTNNWGQEGVAVNKAMELWNYIINPKKANNQQIATSNELPIHNPEGVPVFLPGGRLQVSGIPEMAEWPSGSSSPTQGVIGDSSIAHRSG